MKASCYLCGTARGCAQHLDAIFANLAALRTLFLDTHTILAVDAEQGDPTLMKLVHYKNLNPEINIEILIIRPPRFPQRTRNISRARNAILECIRAVQNRAREVDRDWERDWPYMLMMDLDDVCASPVQLPVVARALDRPAGDWDAISFNRAHYYDIWALSVDPYIYSCWGWENPRKVVEVMRADIQRRLAELPKDQLLACDSAFNGLAIYRLAAFADCDYAWTVPAELIGASRFAKNREALAPHGISQTKTPFGKIFDENDCYCEQDCEHRAFHLAAAQKNGAKIRISPEIAFLHYVNA